MRREGGGIGTGMGGESDERMRAMRRPDSHGAIPTARQKMVLGYQVPMHAEDLAVMFLPVLDGEVVKIAVEELYAAVA